jgi:hypothetical protein
MARLSKRFKRELLKKRRAKLKRIKQGRWRRYKYWTTKLKKTVRRTKSGGLVYKGKLPRHIQKKKKGKKIFYFSKLTHKRISVYLIRRSKKDQYLAELFPYQRIKGIKNFLRDYNDPERHDFSKNVSVSLIEYIKQKRPDLLKL